MYVQVSSVTKKRINKAVAFGIVVFLINVVGTTSYMILGLIAATSCAREHAFTLIAPCVRDGKQ